MTATFIDTHCHLASARFDHDREEVIQACVAAGVHMIESAGTLASARAALRLASRHPEIHASAGVHPTDTATLTDAEWNETATLALDGAVVAIGETGLDYHWETSPPDIQKAWFRKHIDLAMELDKTLVVHARDSVPDVLAMLEPHLRDGLRAAWHCFTAPKRLLGRALETAERNGLFLGVGGLATFEDQKALRASLKLIPDRLLLLETDAPYLIPRPRRSDRNDPRGVIRVAEALAELRGTSPEAIAALAAHNAKTAFRLRVGVGVGFSRKSGQLPPDFLENC